MKNAAELTRLRHGFENRKRTLTELYKEWYRSLRSNFSSSTGIDLELSKSEFQVVIMKTENYNYFNTLRNKLNWGLDARN